MTSEPPSNRKVRLRKPAAEVIELWGQTRDSRLRQLHMVADKIKEIDPTSGLALAATAEIADAFYSEVVRLQAVNAQLAKALAAQALLIEQLKPLPPADGGTPP